MTDRPKRSAVVHTYNSEKHLDKVLSALNRLDEILVLDMESTDRTVEIAQAHGARVIVKERGEHRIPEAYRDFADHAAANDWILVVDSDEIVPPGLLDYLFAELERDYESPRGYMVARKNYFMGKWMRSSYPDYTPRMFKKDGSYWPYAVHTFPTYEGPTVYVPKERTELALIHLANEDTGTLVRKMDTYSNYELERRGRSYSPWKFIYEPPFRFFKSYVLKGGFRDGMPGFIHSVQDAFYRFTLLSKLEEHRQAGEAAEKDIDRDASVVK